ncbi:hypothetical protein [Adhaeribacter aquaticus]|uniref:hypothetical protein n=1 Tax=Adhaeribacter aquaticus TaxID=299567 RepID=UPI000420B39B|nr:hypothetical protein [Adhaeribacter aquaticus]
MGTLAFDRTTKRQIEKVLEYAKLNIYTIDDLLDMINKQMAVPGEDSGHLVLVPVGRWVCYYLVDHPHYGRCHYFSFKPDASGKLPEKSEMEHILKEFGIESDLFEKHIKIDEMDEETEIIIPLA